EAELVDTLKGPKEMNFLCGRSVLERGSEFAGALDADCINEGVGREHAARETSGIHFFDQAFGVCAFESEWAQAFFRNKAPDAAAFAITTRVSERHFVMTDDAIVKIGDVKRAVGSELNIDWPEPRIGRRHEIGRFGGARRRAG